MTISPNLRVKLQMVAERARKAGFLFSYVVEGWKIKLRLKDLKGGIVISSSDLDYIINLLRS